MKAKGTTSLFFFFFCYISCFVSLRAQAKQGDSLRRLMEAKLRSRKSGIDNKFYGQVEIIGDERVLLQDGLKEQDRIEKLPGQPSVEFAQYGGYVTVDADAGRAFYYYFVEAVNDKESKPLLLWLNGGPGCSSLGYGAMEELGPFRVGSDGKTLFYNQFAWNKVANVLFLESPAGVGFSYSNRTDDYNLSGDKMTAEDNYAFLVNWLERFPEYKNRDFFIAGESYAGHYVPQLAHTILQHNIKATKNSINLKGVMIGNAVINDETDEMGMYDYFWTHALISDKIISDIHNYCNFSSDEPSQQCNQVSIDADQNVNSIDIYNIYAPLCLSSDLTAMPKKHPNPIMHFDPCIDNFVHEYLNSPNVQKALHANATNLNYTWEPCSNIIQTWADSPATIIPLLKEFITSGIRVWVFSGDTDGRVPVTSTRYSLDKMGLPIQSSLYPWFHQQEVGGYSLIYEGLTFATVRGAGHMVPSYQPKRALALITHFLDGTPLH